MSLFKPVRYCVRPTLLVPPYLYSVEFSLANISAFGVLAVPGGFDASFTLLKAQAVGVKLISMVCGAEIYGLEAVLCGARAICCNWYVNCVPVTLQHNFFTAINCRRYIAVHHAVELNNGVLTVSEGTARRTKALVCRVLGKQPGEGSIWAGKRVKRVKLTQKSSEGAQDRDFIQYQVGDALVSKFRQMVGLPKEREHRKRDEIPGSLGRIIRWAIPF